MGLVIMRTSNLRRCGERTLVRVGRRVLQWRMFWHKADGSVLAGTGSDFGFGTLPRRGVFDLYLRRRLRRWHSLILRPRIEV